MQVGTSHLCLITVAMDLGATGTCTRMQAGIQNTDDNRRVYKLEKKNKKVRKITHSLPSVSIIFFDKYFMKSRA